DVADDQRTSGDDRERVRTLGQRLQASARQPVVAFGRLVRIRRRADDDLLAFPRLPRQLPTKYLGDIDLDSDRCAVAIIRWAVGATLECAHVTERALVDATHVRVERPAEHHAPDAIEGVAAWLLPIPRSHR